MATLLAIVNEVPAVRAETVNPPTSVATVELQVTPSFVPSVSSVVNKIWLLAVTAVVFTTMELETAFVGRATLPAAAAPQIAGEAELEQLPVVVIFGAVTVPVNVGEADSTMLPDPVYPVTPTGIMRLLPCHS